MVFTDDNIAGSCEQLLTRLHRTSAVARWRLTEAGVAPLVCLDGRFELKQLDPAASDDLVGGLIRLAAVEGGDDWDALLLLTHLLSPTLRSLASQLRDLVSDPLAAVVSELIVQVRSFPACGGPVLYPLHRRTHSWVGNLRMELRSAVLGEVRPRMWLDNGRPEAEDLVADWEDQRFAGVLPGPGDGDVEAVDVLLWVLEAGVPGSDVALLVAMEVGRDRFEWQGADRRVAADHSISVRTLYRRRDKALALVRGAAVDGGYLAAA